MPPTVSASQHAAPTQRKRGKQGAVDLLIPTSPARSQAPAKRRRGKQSDGYLQTPCASGAPSDPMKRQRAKQSAGTLLMKRKRGKQRDGNLPTCSGSSSRPDAPTKRKRGKQGSGNLLMPQSARSDASTKRKPGRPCTKRPPSDQTKRKVANADAAALSDVPADDPVRRLVKIGHKATAAQAAYFFLADAWNLEGRIDLARLRENTGRRFIDASKVKISIRAKSTGGFVEEARSR